MSNERPVVGAALSIEHIAKHRSWIVERQRDLELQDFVTAQVLDGDWQTPATRIKTLLDGYRGRLGLHGPFWGLRIDSHDPLIQAVVTKRLLQGLVICENLRATQMVIHSPYTTWDHNNFDTNAGSRAELVERVHATLTPVVRRAESIGCELVIENIEDKDPFARVELAESFKSNAVRISIDTGHAHYAHGATGAPPVDYYVTAAGHLLTHVHLQDADGYADRHWLPGEGTIRWAAVFRALSRLSSNPRLILEVKDKDRVQEGARYLETLGLAR
jgi:sugar phosphate isomerase/epimerase